MIFFKHLSPQNPSLIARICFLLLIISWSHTVVYGQDNDQTTEPFNSNYLYKYGISPKVFNLLLSPMYQEEVSFSADWILSEEQAGNANQVNLQMDYDPYYEYGNQLFVIVRDQNIYKFKSKKKIKKYISLQNEKFRELKDFTLINEKNIQFLKQDSDTTIFSFSIRKPILPWKIKHVGNFTGRIYVVNGDLKKLSLFSVNKFNSEGVKYNEYSTEVYFKGNRDTGYLIDYYLTHGVGVKNGEPYKSTEKLDIKSYKGKDKLPLKNFVPETLPKEYSSTAVDTFKIKLERSLPYLGNAARKAGYELPLPWGVNLFSHYQKESFILNNIILNDINLSQLIFEQGGSKANVDIGVTAGMADMWILPFLNFSVLYGKVYGNTSVKLELNDEMKALLQWLNRPTNSLDFNVDVGGSIAGVGMTAAGGYKNLFATVASQYMVQTSESTGTKVSAIIVTPLIGLRMPKFVNIMVGAQYQSSDTNITGSFRLDDGAPNYFSLKLEPKTWNFMTGIQRDISNHWTGAFQVGIGERKSSTLILGYRF